MAEVNLADLLETGTLQLILIHEGTNPSETTGDSKKKLEEERDGVITDTGYLMRFGDEEDLPLSRFDMIDTTDLYPVPEPALETLPTFARIELEQKGYLRFVGEYDSNTKSYSPVIVDWTNRSLPKQIGELQDLGLSLHETIYYLLVEVHEEYSVGEWAEIKEIEEESVKKKIESAEEQLKDSSNIPLDSL